MGIGVSLFLIAAGAVLTFAINVTTSGFNINTVGVILMIVGVLGILVDLAIFAPRRRSGAPVVQTGTQRTVVQERDTFV
jgi:beta-lactamase regulating signal transducer with metallopeptidase domain